MPDFPVIPPDSGYLAGAIHPWLPLGDAGFSDIKDARVRPRCQVRTDAANQCDALGDRREAFVGADTFAADICADTFRMSAPLSAPCRASFSRPRRFVFRHPPPTCEASSKPASFLNRSPFSRARRICFSSRPSRLANSRMAMNSWPGADNFLNFTAGDESRRAMPTMQKRPGGTHEGGR